MLILLSPSKSLDFENSASTAAPTLPRLLPQSADLIRIARTLSPADLMQLMGVSENIAALNTARFAQWQTPFTPENAKSALFAFTGDVYQGMQPLAWHDDTVQYAQQKVRILSGLYGVLRPLDLIQPYRLEMKIGLRNAQGSNLYAFWKNDITALLNADLAAQGEATVLNLASNEYFKAIDPKKLQATIYNVAFKELRNGAYKIISFSAKRARGKMCDYVVQHKITQISDLQGFTADNYSYEPTLSTPQNLVFVR